MAYIGADSLKIMADNIREACRAYSAAAREGCEEPEPDYSCGGVEVEEPGIPLWYNPNAVWGVRDEPDLMAAIRDIARGS